MEETSKVNINGNIKRPLEFGSSNFTMNMSPSRLPLLSSCRSSVQVWKKPYLMNFHDSTTNSSTSTNRDTKASYEDKGKSKAEDASPPSDYKITAGSSNGDDRVIDGPVGLSTTEKVFKLGHNNEDSNMDLKRKKRIISNRVSAQRCRMKKLQYVSHMEQQVRDLQAQIAVLSPQLSLYQNQHHLLQVEQENLSTRISLYASNRLLQEAAIAENKAEVNRLRQLHHELQQHRLHKYAKFLNLELPAGVLFEEVANPGLNAELEQYFVLPNSNVQEDGDIDGITAAEVNDVLNKVNKQEESSLEQALHMALAGSWAKADDAELEEKPIWATPKSNSTDPKAQPWTEEADA